LYVLEEVLLRLSPVQHELLRLAFFEDFPHSAIALRSGLPLGTVKSHIRRALKRLYGELSVYDNQHSAV
jgi:RNA polymerase sigma-70 factor (ECF subfamily)